jgi:hypothetical protein
MRAAKNDMPRVGPATDVTVRMREHLLWCRMESPQKNR